MNNKLIYFVELIKNQIVQQVFKQGVMLPSQKHFADLIAKKAATKCCRKKLIDLKYDFRLIINSTKTQEGLTGGQRNIFISV